MMFYNVIDEQRINMTAVMVSVLLHMILFVQLTNTSMNSQSQAPDYLTRISLNLLPVPKEPPQLVKEDIPPPESVRKPKPESKPELQAKPEITKPVPAIIPEQAIAPKVAQEIQRGQSNDPAPIKKHYLNNLLTYIEGHKYYPQAARYRGIEGSINVSFQILDNGEINDLKTIGGPLVLRKAAEQAVAMALPLPVPPSEVNCPLQVSYAMQFRLN